MCVEMDVNLIAGIVIETAGNLLVVLLEILRVELEENYSELVALDETTFWVDSEGLRDHWRKSKVSWSVSFVLKLNCLEFAFIQRTWSKVNLIIRNSLNIWDKRLRITNKRMANTSDKPLQRWCYSDIS